ncbi:A/G-specific adenine glycosylase [Mucisphaera sp.]|uniref:A/G-specific adenine glycosylase n=1 Tax=Mucisphaera sp. TaxID=2913024 RepID=UPI003D129D74
MPRTHTLSTASTEAKTATDLTTWHSKNRRDLPWRAPWGQNPDPYHVLVSEFMLQQTQVATVIPYFHRFLEAFPTLQHLAEAPADTVMRHWQGLGYYRRAKRLQACAQAIVQQHQGRFPQTYDQLADLPGVGPYTAGAIASIAFNQPVPAIDGNANRVLARLFDIPDPVDKTPGKKAIQQAAESLHAAAPRANPGMLNEAIIELGATLCTPTEPQCLLCPVADHCQARASNTIHLRPVTTPKKKPTAVTHHILAIFKPRRGSVPESAGHWLLRQRPASGLWADLWELPTLEEDATPEALTEWAHDTFGLRITTPKRRHRFQHQTTHRTITFVLWHATPQSGRLKPPSARWLTPAQIDQVPLAKPQTTALSQLSVLNPSG